MTHCWTSTDQAPAGTSTFHTCLSSWPRRRGLLRGQLYIGNSNQDIRSSENSPRSYGWTSRRCRRSTDYTKKRNELVAGGRINTHFGSRRLRSLRTVRKIGNWSSSIGGRLHAAVSTPVVKCASQRKRDQPITGRRLRTRRESCRPSLMRPASR